MTENWSRSHPACVVCGTADRPHHARGLCATCYRAWQQSDRMADPERAERVRTSQRAASARWRERQRESVG